MSQQPAVPVASPKGPPSPPTPPGPTAPQTTEQPPEEILEDVGAGLPPWVDAAFPWMVSVTFHLGIFLVFVFAIFLYSHGQSTDDREQIIIPSTFNDPGAEGGIPHPGLGGDPNRDAAQDLVKITNTNGFAQNESKDTAKDLLAAQSAENDAPVIGVGTGGSIGKGAGGVGQGNSGVLAPYGTPGGGGGIGPKSNFFVSGHGKKIVYILDYSGSMLDNFDYLRQEAVKSVNKLTPVQLFSVVMFSEQATAIYPALQRATTDVKRDFAAKIANYRAQGENDDLLDPFKDAFEKAFSMKPDLIYFLTDGHFDPRLMNSIRQLNHDKKVHINTLAFVNREPSYEQQLQDIAKENGGQYKFVSEKDLGGQ